MILEEMSAIYTPWCFLQQPAHPSSELNASFRTLLAAIDQGWNVVEPIMLESGEQGDAQSFHFTLNHPTLGQIYPVTVLATLEVVQFVLSNRYQKVNTVFISQ